MAPATGRQDLFDNLGTARDGFCGKRRLSTYHLQNQILLLQKQLEEERKRGHFILKAKGPPVGLDAVKLKPSNFFNDKKSRERKISVTNPTNTKLYINWNYRWQGSKPEMIPPRRTRKLRISKNVLKCAQEEGYLLISMETSSLSKWVAFPLVDFERANPIDVEATGPSSYRITVENKTLDDLRINPCPHVVLEKYVTRKDGFLVVKGKTTVYHVRVRRVVKDLLYLKAASQDSKWKYKIRASKETSK